jgi:hypothetical protein
MLPLLTHLFSHWSIPLMISSCNLHCYQPVKAQHSAAAKAALGAALRLAQEAKNAAKEAEAVAMAKQYHAAHLSSEYFMYFL